jgi:hypothetical protein
MIFAAISREALYDHVYDFSKPNAGIMSEERQSPLLCLRDSHEHICGSLRG